MSFFNSDFNIKECGEIKLESKRYQTTESKVKRELGERQRISNRNWEYLDLSSSMLIVYDFHSNYAYIAYLRYQINSIPSGITFRMRSS